MDVCVDTVDVSMLREAVVKVAGLVPTEASGNVTQVCHYGVLGIRGCHLATF